MDGVSSIGVVNAILSSEPANRRESDHCNGRSHDGKERTMYAATTSNVSAVLTRSSLFGIALAALTACSSDTASLAAGKGDASTKGDSGPTYDSGPTAMDSGALEGGSSDGSDGGPRFDVTTKNGVVRGKLEGKTRAFLAIPYAAPPTGPNRWKPPAPAAPWSVPRDATTPA